MSSPVTGSLFAPFFFPLGIAFMGAQSAVMMKMAGENWQYGKRRISAMSNEDFNALTPLGLYQLETAELQQIIPSITSSLESMTPLTATIVTEMINTFKVGAQATLAYLNDITDTPIGQVIMLAMNVWMPWMKPLLGEHVSDIITIEQPPTIEAPTIPTRTFKPVIKPPKTKQEVLDQEKERKEHITKTTKDPLMAVFTKHLAGISSINQRLMANTNSQASFQVKQFQAKHLAGIKKALLQAFTNWKKNHRAWLSVNKLL